MECQHEEWLSWLEDARDIVFRAVHNTLRRRGYLPSRSGELADDATQHAFLQLLKSKTASDFLTLSVLVSWLKTTAFNKVWEELRGRKPTVSNLVELVADRSSEAHQEDLTDVIRTVVRMSFEEDLSAEDREILTLKYDARKTDHEIAVKLLPPDDRSDSARSQELRRRRLKALKRLRYYLRKRGVRGFSLDSGFD